MSENTVQLPHDDEEKTWKLVLIISGLITILSLVYLVNSLTKVTEYLGNVSRIEVSAANIVKDVNDATFSTNYEVSSGAYTRLASNVSNYESALQGVKKQA